MGQLSRIMVNVTLPDSPKLRRLGEALGVGPVKALGHLVCLWTRAMTLAETGELPGWTRPDLEVASRWGGRRGLLASCLVRLGWVDKAKDGRFSLHDWDEHQGVIIDDRAQEAAKKRKQRSHARGRHCADCPPNCPGTVPPPVPGTSPPPFPPLPIPSLPSPSLPFQALSEPKATPEAGAQSLPGNTLDALGEALKASNGVAPAEDPQARQHGVEAAFVLSKTLPEASAEALARYVGWLESKPAVPSRRILENARKLVNHRQGMQIQMGDKVPFDRIFAYGIDQAIEHDALSVAYIGKVCQTEYQRIRDGCGRA